jgi:hypothetical protein
LLTIIHAIITVEAAGDGFFTPGKGYQESYDAGLTWQCPTKAYPNITCAVSLSIELTLIPS